MTGPPRNATALNTTVFANVAQVDPVELLLNLPRLVTVAAVRTELEEGTETHPYLEHALAVLGEEIPVSTLSSPTEKVEEKLLHTVDPRERHRHWPLQRSLTERSSLTMEMRVQPRRNVMSA